MVLVHVFCNLIGNAVKHHDRKDGRVEIGWRDCGDAVEFTVADGGPGDAWPQRAAGRADSAARAETRAFGVGRTPTDASRDVC